MKTIFFLALLIIFATAQAQTSLSDNLISDQLQNADSMPEHSQDKYLGVFISEVPKYQGSDKMKTEAVLEMQQEWSNGVLVKITSNKPYDTYKIGKDFSSVQNMDYGVLLGAGLSRQSFITESTGNSNADWMPFVGGFFKFKLAEDIQLNSELLYYFGQYKGGAYADLNLTKSFAITEHQGVSFSVGTVLGNHDFTRTQYGISAAQSIEYGYPTYSPSAGVQDVHVGANWTLNLSSAWILNASIYASHLTSNVSGTKQVENENNGALYVGLAYRF
jgi:outer membrane scaffolding protein for murein synthesis (MipA/OmpV family)